VGVTLSQPDTIRVEPSSFIEDRDTLRFLDAISELARLLHEGKLLEITRHFWRCPFGGNDLDTRSARKRKPVEEKTDTTVGFLTHVIDEKHLCRVDALFQPLPKEERVRFLERFGPFSSPFCYHEQLVRGANGKSTRIKFIGVFVGSAYFETSLRRDMAAYEKVKLMAVRARELGVTHLGLGQYTSIVSENGLLLRGRGMRVTTGNSLTAGFAYQALLAALAARGLRPQDARIGIVGATGNIGNVLSQLLGDCAGALRLVYREPFEQSRKFQEAVQAVVDGSKIDRSRIETSHEPSSLLDCDAIVLGTNTVQTLLLPEHLREGAIVLDVSVPSNVDPRVFTERPDVQCFHGGLAKLPFDQIIESEWIPTPRGETFACVAETLTTALTGRTDDFSVGAIAKARVLEALELANSVGITVGSPRPLKET
jgi:predicted amino acid dehydrogenase